MKNRITALLILAAASSLPGVEPSDQYQRISPDLVREVDQAKEKQRSGDLYGAQSLLNDVLKRRSDYYRALYNLGLLYQIEGAYSKAIETLKRAEAIRYEQSIPDNSVLNSLGSAYKDSGDFSKAEEYFRAAYATKDENDGALNELILNNLGSLYLQKGQTTDARKYLTESKEKYQSATADTNLKIVADYERRQNQTQITGAMWAVYGQQPKAGSNWSERHFNVEGGAKTAIPKPNETVTAFDNVYIRKNRPTWDDQIGDYVHGPIVGYIKPGDKVRVLEVVDNNPADDENAWYWIRLSRLSKQ
jgi:tetratricopeptide (TPR) repeat protein